MMKLGPFLLSLGIVEVKDISKEAIALICESIENAVRGGVDPTISEWNSLSSVEQAAFVEANDVVWRERCSMIGEASQSLVHAAYVRDEEDGHDAMARATVDTMVQKNLGKLEADKRVEVTERL